MIALRIATLALMMTQQGVVDPTYESPALRNLVAAVAENNRHVARTLSGYSGRVEAEAAIVRTDADGRERVSSLQQVALQVVWSRDGSYSEHAIGERALARGLLRFDVRKVPSFTVPALYGNRLDLLLGPFGAREGGDPTAGPDDPQALHPLAEGRERIYAYNGGTVVERWAVSGRAISIARIQVTTRRVPEVRTTVFTGDLFIDVERRQLVGLRGRIQEIGGRRGAIKETAATLVREIGKLEVVTAEFDGRYWLPSIERIELRLTSVLARNEAVSLRISSRFIELRPDSRLNAGVADTLASHPTAHPRRITIASADSLERYAQWRDGLGAVTAADAFDHLAGYDAADSDRSPSSNATFGTRTLREAIRYNKVEGLFTGVGGTLPLARLVRGTSIDLNGGRGWSDAAWRGSAQLRFDSGDWRLGVGGGRSLEGTNDFMYPPNHAPLLASAIFSRDDFDYVDRRSLGIFAERRPLGGKSRLRAEFGRMRDAGAEQSARAGLIRGDSGFRENRPVTFGRFTRAVLAYERNPDVLAEYLHPGIGVMVRGEIGRGDLDYNRFDARLTVQRPFGRHLTVGARVDVGALVARGAVPLQQVIELGGPEQLPGFGYKAFGGDRAALGQFSASIPLESLIGRAAQQRRLRAHLSTTIFVGVASSTGPNVASALNTLRMGAPACPVGAPCAADGVPQTSIQLGLRLLDGALFVGAKRVISQRDRWTLALSAGIF